MEKEEASLYLFLPYVVLQAASKGQVESIPILGRETLRAEGMENMGLKVWPAMECSAAQLEPLPYSLCVSLCLWWSLSLLL